MGSEGYSALQQGKFINMRETDDFWDHGDENNVDTKCFSQQFVFLRDTYMNNQSSKPKTRRRKWTQKDMTNAFNAVKCTGMSLRGAASHYNVPESTLRDRVHGRVSLDCSRPGPPTFFTYEEEKKMVDHILFMSKIGYPYTRNQVVELAGDMTKAVDRIAPFKFLNPSQAWFYAFLNRWPDLKNYLYGPRSNRKSKGVSAESIQAYYDNLEKVLIKYEIKNKPENIWMTDEISIACDNSNVPKILPITIQRPQSNTYWNPTAAVLGAGNAAGDKIPAFLMFKASEITNEMMEGTVRGSKFATSSTGWINADAFIQWYERHFRPLISQRPVILLYDGHLQFVTVRVLEKAKEDNVLLFPLPPHPPYNHCVESSCFAAYPKYFNRKIQKFHDDFKRNVNKTNVSKIICQAYECALQPINLISIFFKLGICPYNNLSSTIAPYMTDNYTEYGNDENQENHESDYSQYGKICQSELSTDIENSGDSPIDRNYATEETHSYQIPKNTHYHTSSLHSVINNTPSLDTNHNISSSIMSTPTISILSNNHINSTSIISSPSKFGPQLTPNYSASTPVKVLDNMASKAMNQIHAQRSDMTVNNSKLIPISTNPDQNNASSFIPVKNLSTNRNSVILCSNKNKISPNSNPIKLIPTSTDQFNSSVGSNNESSVYVVSPTISRSNPPNSTPIKVIKTNNNSTNVIIKTNTNDNRPLVRLHSISTDDQPLPKKPALVMAKSDGFIRTDSNTPVKYTSCYSAHTSTNKMVLTSGQSTTEISSIQSISDINRNNELSETIIPSSSLEMAELMEIKPEIIAHEADEISQTCNVCGRVEPPGLSQMPVDNEELVVDWARCDFCYKWVHLLPCCDSRCVQPDNRFKCIVCIGSEIKDDIDNNNDVTSTIMQEVEEEEVVEQEQVLEHEHILSESMDTTITNHTIDETQHQISNNNSTNVSYQNEPMDISDQIK